MEIILNQAQIRVSDLPNGGKLLQFITSTGIVVTAPLDANAAEIVASGLRNGIIIASSPIAPPPINGKPN